MERGRMLMRLRKFRHGLVQGLAVGVIAAGGMTEARADDVAVEFPEGSVHAFLQLSEASGKVIAGGDLVEMIRGDQVTLRVIFRFKDGSLDDERTVYTQRGHFRLLSDRHIQRGPSFTHAVDVAVEMSTGMVTTRTGAAGHEMETKEHMDLPTDLANGMVLMMLKNLAAKSGARTVSYLAATPKPRLVHLVLTPGAETGFVVGGVRHEAVQYTVKPEIGGLAGVLAPVMGMQPKITAVWMSGGEVPAFARLEGPTFLGGPEWKLEMAKPSWPAGAVKSGEATAADGEIVR